MAFDAIGAVPCESVHKAVTRAHCRGKTPRCAISVRPFHDSVDAYGVAQRHGAGHARGVIGERLTGGRNTASVIRVGETGRRSRSAGSEFADARCALIDWDSCAPGARLSDLGYMAWTWCIQASGHVPLACWWLRV
jgi:hypothetical protein